MPIPSNALGYKNLPKQSLNYDKYSNNLGFKKRNVFTQDFCLLFHANNLRCYGSLQV